MITIPKPDVGMWDKQYPIAWREWIRAVIRANSFQDENECLRVVMKASKGTVNPAVVKEVYKEESL